MKIVMLISPQVIFNSLKIYQLFSKKETKMILEHEEPVQSNYQETTILLNHNH